MIVADTNLIAYLLVPGAFTAQAEAVYEKDPRWAAPFLWRSEMRNVLWMYVRKGQLSLPEAMQTMQDAEALLVGREYQVESGPVLALATSAARSPYDCEFVNLAQDLAVPLVTSDQKVIASFPRIATSMAAFAS